MSYRKPIFTCMLAIAMVSCASERVEAAVKGRTYNVTARKNLSREFKDFYNFRSDGTFLAVRGGTGKWSQFNLVVISLWTAEFSTGQTKVDMIGIQIGSSISGIGSNQKGDIFLSHGTEGMFEHPGVGSSRQVSNEAAQPLALD